MAPGRGVVGGSGIRNEYMYMASGDAEGGSGIREECGDGSGIREGVVVGMASGRGVARTVLGTDTIHKKTWGNFGAFVGIDNFLMF